MNVHLLRLAYGVPTMAGIAAILFASARFSVAPLASAAIVFLAYCIGGVIVSIRHDR